MTDKYVVIARRLLFGAIACPVATAVVVSTQAVPASLLPPCRGAAAPVSWVSLADAGDAGVLGLWCESVGPPAVRAALPDPEAAGTLIVATWNVHVGRGDVAALRRWIEARSAPSGRRAALVLLLQEAVRAGADVPEGPPPGLRVPRRINRGRERPDILALAGSLGLHAVYVPSMRNGSADPDGREDRGNAILSTEPLTDLTAIELPFARQRRVAIKATLTLAGRAVHLLDVHLDTRGGRVRQAQALAGYLSSLPRGHGDWLILGGDLNALRGPRDHAFRVLAATWPAVACGEGRTNRWPIALDVFARWWRGRTDFLFGAPAAALAGVTCETVDGYFGSDHRPIVLTIPATAN